MIEIGDVPIKLKLTACAVPSTENKQIANKMFVIVVSFGLYMITPLDGRNDTLRS
jgi:hypothetical protein